MNNVVYHINKDKGVVVCILKCDTEEPQLIFESTLFKIYRADNIRVCGIYDPNRNTKINEQYVGIARCSKNDTFDEEFGKKLALARAKVKKTYALQKQFFKYIDALDQVNYIVGKKHDKLYSAYSRSVEEATSLLKEAYK